MKYQALPIYLTIAAASLSSCVNTKKYGEVSPNSNSEYYSIKFNTGTAVSPNEIEYTVKKPQKNNLVQVEVKSNRLFITETKGKPAATTYKVQPKDVDTKTFTKLTKIASNQDIEGKDVFPSPLQNFKPEATDQTFFDDPKTIPLENTVSVGKNTNLMKSKAFRYVEIQPVFQAMTIPFKYRAQLNDTIPSQVTTSANVGFGYGRKFSFRKFDQRFRNSSFLKANHPSFSVTPGVFAGPSLIKLENGKSVNEQIELDRTVAGFTAGGFIVAGINKFNIGLAFGFDQALGKDSSKWIYQKDPFWWGFILSFEFIK